MKKFEVEIVEVLRRVVEVVADDSFVAIQKVEEQYNNEEYVLDSSDFDGVSFNIVKVEKEESKKEIVKCEKKELPKIKVHLINKTSYENETNWITYSIGDVYAYEISEAFEEGDEKILQDMIDKKIVNFYEKFINKKTIKEVHPTLADMIINCLQSDNDMWFVEYGEISEKEIELVKKEVERFKLQEYVTFDEDDCAVTVYGGVITEFLF